MSPRLPTLDSTDDVAAILGCSTGHELAVAAAAFITADNDEKQFSRQELHAEMKESRHFTESYGKNLTRILNKLTRMGELNRVATTKYVISPRCWQRIVNKLTQSEHRTNGTYLRLHDHARQISDSRNREFVEEAVECLEHRLYRAAVLLSWIGAISVLRNYVYEHELDCFNNELSRRQPKSKTIRAESDFSDIRESVFLDVLAAIAVIDQDIKRQLKECLTLRNSCGHPNLLKVEHYRVSAHIEVLILHVFARFV